MKNLAVLFIAFLLMILSSCSEDSMDIDQCTYVKVEMHLDEETCTGFDPHTDQSRVVSRYYTGESKTGGCSGTYKEGRMMSLPNPSGIGTHCAWVGYELKN